jgi:hypothetical protein
MDCSSCTPVKGQPVSLGFGCPYNKLKGIADEPISEVSHVIWRRQYHIMWVPKYPVPSINIPSVDASRMRPIPLCSSLFSQSWPKWNGCCGISTDGLKNIPHNALNYFIFIVLKDENLVVNKSHQFNHQSISQPSQKEVTWATVT